MKSSQIKFYRKEVSKEDSHSILYTNKHTSKSGFVLIFICAHSNLYTNKHTSKSGYVLIFICAMTISFFWQVQAVWVVG